MPTSKSSKKASASSGTSKSSAKKSTGKAPAASKSSANKAGGAKKTSAKRSSGTTKQLKETAVKVLAGAAAGAVRAIIPPLEEAAGTGEKAAGIKRPSSKKQAAKSGGKPAGKSGAKSKK